MSRKVMAAILAHLEVKSLLSDEHFSVDGALVKAWASMKSFQPKESAAPPHNSNETHASVTNPDARFYKKSPGAGGGLCFMGEMRP